MRCDPLAHRYLLSVFLAKYTQSAVMETLKLVFISVLLLSNVFCQDMDADIWREDIEEVKFFKPAGTFFAASVLSEYV